jgi:hypothetical protein
MSDRFDGGISALQNENIRLRGYAVLATELLGAMVTMAENANAGAWHNGVSHNGIEEGEVQAYRLIEKCRALLASNVIPTTPLENPAAAACAGTTSSPDRMPDARPEAVVAGPARCFTCGAPATIAIKLPEGDPIPAKDFIEAQRLLRKHQRAWPNEDLYIRAEYAPPLERPEISTQLTPGVIEALRNGRQADPDGVMVTVSRQACEEAAAALERHQRGREIPEGWKLVPVEPTPEMLAAAKPRPAHWDVIVERQPNLKLDMDVAIEADRMSARSTYRTMLDAAPGCEYRT